MMKGRVCIRERRFPSENAQEAVQVYQDIWHRWAGHCDEMYVDPHGAYVSDQFKRMAQEGAIKLKVTASDSHWQLGRTEIHGRLIKDMLTSIDEDVGIPTDEAFKEFLVHCLYSRFLRFLQGQ